MAMGSAKMFDYWSEILKLPSIGPMYAFSKEFQAYADDFVSLGKIVSEMRANLEHYWTLVNQAYSKAFAETMEKSPAKMATKEDFEQYRRAMIEAFEDSFTDLFASSKFSEIYGKVFSNQLDLSGALQRIAEKNTKVLNLPTRSEMDEVLKDIHDLKKSFRELKKSLEMAKTNDQTRVTEV